MRIIFVAALASALLTVACSGPPHLTPGPHLEVAPDAVLPPPTPEDLTRGTRAYRIGPLDKLTVSVFNVPDLSMKIQVDASGSLSFPLAGTVQAGGKTPDELARALEAALRNYVRNPQVTVNLEETVSQLITVSGEVREPGLYPVVGRLTLMRAVATAKGTSEYARLEDVVVFRTVGDRQMAALYNLEAIRRGTYPDPEVFANDVVVVGDSPSRRLFRDILTVTPLLTPLIYVLR